MQKIFFDVDGVLIRGFHYRPELRHRWDRDLQKDFGIDPEKFSKGFFETPFSTEVLPGKRELKDALAEHLPRYGFNGDPQIFMDYWLYKDANLNVDLISHVQSLRDSGKVRLFIATNQAHNRANFLMENLGLQKYFEYMFYSARMGVMKPHKGYFNYIATNLPIEEGERPILFDDTPAVIEMARSSGWDAYEYVDVSSLKQCRYVAELLKL